MRRIPALIVSGFLGSGKTTFVRHLLTEARRDGARLAILSNEFGDTGIDRALLDAGQDGIVELDGGCVCCRLSDALGETVARLIDTARPDRLVVETSGVALPGEIVIQFWRPPIEDRVDRVRVIVLVDAPRFADPAHREDETFREQIEAADELVISKVDLVDPAAVDAAEDALAALGRPIRRAIQGVAPGPWFDDDGALRPDDSPHPHDHAMFGTEEIQVSDGAEPEAVVTRIAALGSLRAKGFFRSPDGIRLLQAVGDRVEVEIPPSEPPAHLVGRIVVIRRLQDRSAAAEEVAARDGVD